MTSRQWQTFAAAKDRLPCSFARAVDGGTEDASAEPIAAHARDVHRRISGRLDGHLAERVVDGRRQATVDRCNGTIVQINATCWHELKAINMI